MKNRAAMAACLFGALVLSACSGPTDELQQWMDEVRQETRPKTYTVEEPKTFEPFPYQAAGQTSPFDPLKVTEALRKLASASPNSLAPDLNRRREALESFPLDTITMVGTLEKPRLRLALLSVQNIVYQVKIGNYVGQNFGMVTNITEGEVTLKEVVQDAAGEWVERVSTLQLQESIK